MEPSPKKMKQFVAKLLESTNEGTLTHKIIRQKFADHLGTDESSISSDIRKQLKAIVSAVMMPATKVEAVEESANSNTLESVSNQEQKVQHLHDKSRDTAGYSDDLKVKSVAAQKKKKRPRMQSSDSDGNSGDDGAKIQTMTDLLHVNSNDNENNEYNVRNDKTNVQTTVETTDEGVVDVKGTKQNEVDNKSKAIRLSSRERLNSQSHDEKQELAVTSSEDDDSDVSAKKPFAVLKLVKCSAKAKSASELSDLDEREASDCTTSFAPANQSNEKRPSTSQKSAKHKSHDVRVSDEGDNDEDEDDDDDDTEDVGDANDTSSSDSESKLTKRTQKAHDSSGDSDSDEHTQAASRKRAKKPLASKQKKSKLDEDKVSKKERHSGKSSAKSEDSRAVTRLKRLIAAAGMKRPYVRLLADCKSEAAKVRVLKGLLEKAGLEGKPTLENCKKLKLKREEAAELADLDPTNIITSTGSSRSRRTSWYDSGREAESSSASSQKMSKRRFAFIISSDESDSD